MGRDELAESLDCNQNDNTRFERSSRATPNRNWASNIPRKTMLLLNLDPCFSVVKLLTVLA
jgi:hypothetical protein